MDFMRPIAEGPTSAPDGRTAPAQKRRATIVANGTGLSCTNAASALAQTTELTTATLRGRRKLRLLHHLAKVEENRRRGKAKVNGERMTVFSPR